MRHRPAKPNAAPNPAGLRFASSCVVPTLNRTATGTFPASEEQRFVYALDCSREFCASPSIDPRQCAAGHGADVCRV